MKSVVSIILYVLKDEFKKFSNILGWVLTTSVWIMEHIGEINALLTMFLTICSIFWVVTKIVLALKGHKEKGED